MDAGPYSLRELLVMAKAKRRDEWDRLANLMVLIANCNRDRKRKSSPFEYDDFMPKTFREPGARRQTAFTIGIGHGGFGLLKKMLFTGDGESRIGRIRNGRERREGGRRIR